MNEQEKWNHEDVKGVDVALSEHPGFGVEIVLIVRFAEKQLFVPLAVEHARLLGRGLLDYADDVKVKLRRGSQN
jgi:hypothetical protein